jgi:hypothetical protein
MAGIGPQDLHTICEELLAASVEALDTIPSYVSGLDGAPERRYVSPGEPAADCCPQLTVHSILLEEAPTEPSGLPIQRRAGRHIRLNHVVLAITLFRCVPVPRESLSGFDPPAAEDLQAAAEQLNADAWAIWHHLFNMVDSGTLLTRCGGIIAEGATALTPSGGCAGWAFTYRIKLDGYEEDLD